MAAHHQDELELAQNEGLVSHDATEHEDLDDDEGDLDDDDMLDKISSSPSIDDGGLPCQLPTPNNLQQYAARCSSPAPDSFSEARSSSPYLDLPDYLPVQLPLKQAAKVSAESPLRHHHLPGAWPDKIDEIDQQPSENGAARAMGNDSKIGMRPSREDLQGCGHSGRSYREDLDTTGTEQITEDGMSRRDSKDEQTDNDEAIGIQDEIDDIEDLIVPYEGFTDEDDDDDLPLESRGPRFVDSGWGGECLHDTEDIDFELVYALHTFIATVEGQANATKGDAMVLLDDSNSYWWLVRVVKDSSIGTMSSTSLGHPLRSTTNTSKVTYRPSISKHRPKGSLV